MNEPHQLMSEPQVSSNEATWLDEAYARKILDKYTGNRLKEVIRWSKKLATKKGENYASTLHLVQFKYTTQDEPKLVRDISFIFKSRLENELMSHIEETFNVFHREAQVYTVIMGAAHKLLRTIDDDTIFGPRAVYVDDRVIVQENLKDLGYSIENVKDGLDNLHCRLVVEKMAKFHAITMVLYKQNPDDFRHHLPSNISEQPSPLHDLYKNCIQSTVEYCRQNPKLQKYTTKLEAFGEMIIPKMINVFSRNQTDRFHVLNHGDLWVNNLMFRKNSQGLPDDLLMVDYQEGFYGSPGIDWNCFIFSSWRNETFVNNLQELIEFYQQILTNILHKLNYASRIPTVDDVKKEISNKSYHGLGIATCMLPILINEHEDLVDPMNFIDDTEEVRNIRRLIFNNPKYGERLEAFLPYFLENGIL